MNRLRIGTRGSQLALWQARHVAERIAALPGAPAVELVVIETAGDRVLDLPLVSLPGKTWFTKEIEDALTENRIDVAVHSLKDLATELPAGLMLAAVLEREDPRDVLVIRAGAPAAARSAPGSRLDQLSLDTLPVRARVGTSSVRRRAFLARCRPDLELVELRGNVPTRLAKLDAGIGATELGAASSRPDFDAIVLAAAGLLRLGLAARIHTPLPVERLPPAPGQGALAVEIRAADDALAELLAALDHPPTRAATTAERAVLHHLGGGCQAPVGALACWTETFSKDLRVAATEASAPATAGKLELTAAVCAPDGSAAVWASLSGAAAAAERLGGDLAARLLASGAADLLEMAQDEPARRLSPPGE